jgi:hypothetical protein
MHARSTLHTLRTLTSLIAVLLALAATPALAANVHYVVGPTVTTTATSVTSSGKLAGLGNENVTITQNVDVNVTCANPGKNTDVPGQRQHVSSTISDLHPENGTLTFSITTDFGDLSGACPNGKWVATGTFAGGTLNVYQGGQLVLSSPIA